MKEQKPEIIINDRTERGNMRQVGYEGNVFIALIRKQTGCKSISITKNNRWRESCL